MKKISTQIFALVICIAAFASCSKDVKKPASKAVVSNASTTKTGSGTTTSTTTTQTTTSTQSGHTCGGSSGYYGGH